MNPLKVVVGALLALASVSSYAAVYRWVDTEGHVHYTDKAEPNSEPINIRTGQPRDTTPLPSSSTTSSATSSSSGTSAPTTQEQKVALCAQKKQQLASYKTATKIVETDSLGRKHEFTAEEQTQLVTKAQQEMQEACGAAGVSTSSVAP